jgi:hypothetical protein
MREGLMDFSERYRRGEHVEVWNELLALGAAVRQPPHAAPAQAVATETMRRVRRNCDRIIARLRALGYVFDRYPDGSRRSFAPGPLTPPSAALRADQAELEEQTGPLPLSLAAFWEEVGAVDLVGRARGWPGGLDPLVVDPPEGALSFLFDEEADDEPGRMFAALAPDDLHKDNISGGDPYGLHLPNPAADFIFLDERHNLPFVAYLRFAILRWGGFPGLHGRAEPFAPLIGLAADLEPF